MATRSTRNIFLAVAAGVGVIGASFDVSANAVRVATASGFFPTRYLSILVVGMIGPIFLVLGFGAAVIGFVQAPTGLRRRILAVAAALFVGYAMTSASTGTLQSTGGGLESSAATQIALAIAGAGSGVAFGVATALVAAAMIEGASRRLLRWASLALGLYFACLATTAGIELHFYANFHVPGRIEAAVALNGGGAVVGVIAAVVAAIGWRAGATNSVTLSVSAALFGCGFLLESIGWVLFATVASSASSWLEFASWLMYVFAAGCATAAFLCSPRARRHDAQPQAAVAG